MRKPISKPKMRRKKKKSVISHNIDEGNLDISICLSGQMYARKCPSINIFFLFFIYTATSYIATYQNWAAQLNSTSGKI